MRTDLEQAQEYEYAAAWCAAHGLEGAVGDPLPTLLDAEVCEQISADPQAFAEAVRRHAYARAMERLNLPEE